MKDQSKSVDHFISNETTLCDPSQILAHSTKVSSLDQAYCQHPIIQAYGSPEKDIFIDQAKVSIGSCTYHHPMILPLYDVDLNIIQCAVLQKNMPVQVIPNSLSHGFAYYGTLRKDQPVIVVCDLEAFFKIAQTNYSVILITLNNLCEKRKGLRKSDFQQIASVINKLSIAGYQHLYMPVKAELIRNADFEHLDKTTSITLLNQYQKVENKDLFIDLFKDEETEDVQGFFDTSIAKTVNSKTILPVGHLTMPMQWENGYFHVLTDGVYFVEGDPQENQRKKFICSPIWVSAKTRDKSHQNWGIILNWLDDLGHLHKQIFSRTLFQSDGVDLRKELAFRGVSIASDHKARALLQSYLISFKTEKYALCVEQVGWHDDVYVLPHTYIGNKETNEEVIFQATHTLENNYQFKGTLQTWRTEVAALVENHKFLVFALCTAFSGQLLELLNQQGSGFHFNGSSSKGKSTALDLASSVWGRPQTFVKTWRSTGNALEHIASMHNDNFLALDEMAEISNPKELGNIIYMLVNGSGKNRMTKSLISRPSTKWKLVFLSSGEKKLKEIMAEQDQITKLGQEVRLADIDIEHSKFGIFDLVNFAENAAQQSILIKKKIDTCYGVAGIAWLEYLTSNKPQIMSEAKQLLNEYQNKLIGEKYESEGHIIRVFNAFALVAVAGELATRANITGWSEGNAFQMVSNIANSWLKAFKQVGRAEECKALGQIKAFIQANEWTRFECVDSKQDNHQQIANRVGYWKQEETEKLFYVFTDQYKNKLCKGFDSRKVTNVLKRLGFLRHDKRSSTKTIRYGKHTIKVYAIPSTILSWEMPID